MDFPGEKLAIRMWETLAEKGIGKLFAPWQIRREGRAHADARRHELLLLTQAERDAGHILAGRRTFDTSGRLLSAPEASGEAHHDIGSPALDLARLATSVEETIVGDALRREINASKAILVAEESLERGTGPDPTDKPGDDWLFRWRDSAGEVSDTELQRLWGSLLAGEFREPGTFSLRTITFLRNLSRSEAMQIARLAPFAVKDFIFSDAAGILEAEGIDFGFLLEMQTLGIVTGVGGLGVSISMGPGTKGGFTNILVSHEKALIVTHEDEKRTLKLSAYPLTDIGQQVLRLGKFQAHVPYLTAVGHALVKQEFKVFLADAMPLGGGKYQCPNRQEILLPPGAPQSPQE